MQLLRVIDILCTVVKKFLEGKLVLLRGRKIARSLLYMSAGIVMLNNALILLAFAFYNYLLTLFFSPVVSALLSGLLFLLIAAILLGFAYKTIITKQCLQNSDPIHTELRDALDAFLSGFLNGK